ncbi:MAG: metallophosphoesterase [Myxococcaceae bacterium]
MNPPTTASTPRRPTWPRRQVWGFAVFATFITVLFAWLHQYVGSRLFGSLPLGLQPLAWGVLWGLFLSLPVGPILERVAPRRLGYSLRLVAYLWLGTFGLILVAVALTDLLKPLLAQWPVLGDWQAPAVAALAIPAAIWGFVSAQRPPRVKRLGFEMPGLGAELSGLRIVQLSDVHIGESFLDGRWLSRVVQQVNALSPDVVVITGDLVDGSVARLRDDVAPLANLRAPLGVFFITGNHEYYSGAESWLECIRGLGIRVLLNEHVVLKRGNASLVLGGIPDPTGAQFHPSHRINLARTFEGADPALPRLLLAHQPKSAEHAAGHGVTLQLSGHTHGGQIFPFNFFVRLQQPVVSGWNQVAGVWVYTHAGTGYWGPPMRVGTFSEIAEITLLSGVAAHPA